MDLAPEMFADGLARSLADRFQSRSALAEHDRALAVALDQNLLVDDDRPVLALLIFLGVDGRRIGQLGVELEVDLLAGHFGRDHPVGGIAQLVVGEMPRAFRHRRGERALQVRNPVAAGCRDHEYRFGLQSQ